MGKLIFTHFPLFFRYFYNICSDVLTDSLAFIFPFFLLMIDVLKIQITMEVKKVLFKNIS